MRLTTAEQMRELDRKAIEEEGIPSIDLMDQAAAGIVATALSLLSKKAGRVAVFCGAGNNGGDGIAVARLLLLRKMQVRAFFIGEYEKMTPDAAEETRRLSECGLELEKFDAESLEQCAFVESCHVIIDAIFGVGLSRDIKSDSLYAAAIALINRSSGTVIAADIASGIEANTGKILGCAVKADKTITFTEQKIGHAVGDGFLYSGAVEVWVTKQLR